MDPAQAMIPGRGRLFGHRQQVLRRYGLKPNLKIPGAMWLIETFMYHGISGQVEPGRLRDLSARIPGYSARLKGEEIKSCLIRFTMVSGSGPTLVNRTDLFSKAHATFLLCV
jgi:hypothetical protein